MVMLLTTCNICFADTPYLNNSKQLITNDNSVDDTPQKQLIISEQVINQFSVEKGKVYTSLGKHNVSTQNHQDLTGVLKDHKINLDSCIYSVKVTQKNLNQNYYKDNEYLRSAFGFEFTFTNCKDEEKKAAQIGGLENNYSPTMIDAIKMPITVYFNGNGKSVYLVSIYGMSRYHKLQGIDIKALFIPPK